MSNEDQKDFADVDFGEELPETLADVSIETIRVFTKAANMNFGRFTDHDEARKSGLPGAIVPGIMSQGIFAAVIHSWAPLVLCQCSKDVQKRSMHIYNAFLMHS